MTFRDQMRRRSILGQTLWIAGCVTMGVTDLMYRLSNRPLMAVYCFVALLLMGIALLLPPRCPTCTARLQWPVRQIAKETAITGCPKCNMSFDSPIETQQQR
jgi:hypothetical protein